MRERSERQQHTEERRRERVGSLAIVGAAYEELQQAKKKYEDAVMSAHTYGATNMAIARRVGLTETAIRLFIKRREDKQ